ncbi:MAG: NfeD family protein [bacterium]
MELLSNYNLWMLAAVTWDQVFLICFWVGLIFAVISGILSGVLGFGGHDLGGVDMHADVGHDLGATSGGLHPDALGGGAEMPHLAPINAVTISTFITAFGGIGLLALKMWNLSPGMSLGLASVSGILVATVVFFFFAKVFALTQSSSEVKVAQLVGHPAVVITPIPENGLGEVAYVMKGSRLNASAKSEDGKPIANHTSVVISKVVSGYLIVRPPDGPAAGG